MNITKKLFISVLIILFFKSTFAFSNYNDSLPQQDSVITIAMTGDVMFGTTVTEVRLVQNEGKDLFKHVNNILNDADVAVGNLECVLSDNAKHRDKGKSKYAFSFRSPAFGALRLKEAGYDFMGMANNHAYDCYQEGIEHSKANLDSVGIGHAGSIGDEFSIKEINGINFGFVAFGHNSTVLRTYDDSTVTRIITELRPKVDILIVCFHGGAEGLEYAHLPQGQEYYLGENRGDLRKFSHLCIDLGADIVYGHGPHIVRAIEVYNGHLIAYSLGNFCTPGGISVVGKKGYAPVLVANIDMKTGKFVDGKIHSFIQQYGIGPQLDKKNIVAAEIRNLTETDIANPCFLIKDDGTIVLK